MAEQAEETEEAEEKKAPPKRGLHGWKAVFAIFGCGSLAAFGVFGVVLLLFGGFLSVMSDGVESDAEDAPVAQTPDAPRDEFNEDIFDFCDIIMSISAVDITLSSEVGRPTDTALDGGDPRENDLVRSDQCAGILRPEGSGGGAVPWDFEFAYRAIIHSEDGDRDELSGVDLEDWRSEVEGSGIDIEESGDSSMADESYYFYGTPENGEGSSYTVIARKRSAVFRISMDSEDEISPSEFANEANKFDGRLDNDFGQFIPE